MVKVVFPNPFEIDGSWFKGNIHSHSINSDGILNVFQLSFLYKANGYDFLFITDHNKLTDVSEISEKMEDFLVLPGEEINAGKSRVGTEYHILSLNITEEIPKGDPQVIINETLRQGGEAVIAHPYWSALTVEDILNLKGFLGIEIFNTTCEFSIGKGYSTIIWDDLLVRGRNTYGFVTDDVHWHFNPHRPVDACYGYIMVKAEDLTANLIMESLRRGLFYSSTGPKIIDMEVDEESVYVKTSPVKIINFISNSSLGERFTGISNPITEATYRFRGKETYVRVEIEDYEGRRAWTNPIYLEK